MTEPISLGLQLDQSLIRYILNLSACVRCLVFSASNHAWIAQIPLGSSCHVSTR